MGILPSPILRGGRDAAAPHPCVTPRQNEGIWGKIRSSRQKGEFTNTLHSQLFTAATTSRGGTVEPGTTTDLGIPATWREPPRILCSTTRTEQETARPPQASPWLLFQHILLKPSRALPVLEFRDQFLSTMEASGKLLDHRGHNNCSWFWSVRGEKGSNTRSGCCPVLFLAAPMAAFQPGGFSEEVWMFVTWGIAWLR